MSYKKHRFGSTDIKTGRIDNLCISYDAYESDPDKVLATRRFPVMLFTPDMEDTRNHHHIQLSIPEARKLHKWLTEFLEHRDAVSRELQEEMRNREMIVYRVENKDGSGPYDKTDRSWANPNHFDSDGNHPEPDDEFGYGWRRLFNNDWVGDRSRFGFDSTEKLEAWFSPAERKKLAKAGFHVAVYEVAGAVCSETQVVFSKEHAKLLRLFSL